jgi:hypothetical protein
MNNLTLQQQVIIINNFESDTPKNAQKVCLISNKDKQKGKYSTKCTKIAITQQKIERQIDVISNSIDKHNKKKAFYKKCKSK